MDARTSEFAASHVKAHFSEMLDRAEAGEELTIRRHGRVVARLSPARHTLTVDERRKAHVEFLAWRRTHGPTLGPDLTIKQLVNEGRRF